jgi:hypothetical protein
LALTDYTTLYPRRQNCSKLVFLIEVLPKWKKAVLGFWRVPVPV